MSKQKDKHISTLEVPPDDFCDWWNPSGIQQPSGAQTGGHPHARRVWARNDKGWWRRVPFGLSAIMAWNAAIYRVQWYCAKALNLTAPQAARISEWTAGDGDLLELLDAIKLDKPLKPILEKAGAYREPEDLKPFVSIAQSVDEQSRWVTREVYDVLKPVGKLKPARARLLPPSEPEPIDFDIRPSAE